MPALPLWLIAGLLASGAGIMNPPSSGPLRAASADVDGAIRDVAARSATARALVARLGCTDAIVYVERTPSPQVPTARTKLVTTVEGARFIRISINSGVTFADLGPLLAHELQHALEIAERDQVRDEGDVRRLYQKIGYARGGDRFETDAARQVEWEVRKELHAKIGG